MNTKPTYTDWFWSFTDIDGYRIVTNGINPSGGTHRGEGRHFYSTESELKAAISTFEADGFRHLKHVNRA